LASFSRGLLKINYDKKESSVILEKHEIIFMIKCLEIVLSSYNNLPLDDLPEEMWQFYHSLLDIKAKLEKLLTQAKDDEEQQN